jgi:hypothetical protein
MMHKPQKSPGEMLTREESFNLFFAIAKCYATCLVVFTRHTFGKEALGFNGLGAFILIPMYATFAKVPEMFDFWVLWLVALFVHRVRTITATVKGIIRHSRDGGQLWLGSLFGLVKSPKGAQFIEFLICLGIGVQLKSVSPGVGSFVIGGSVALLFVALIENQMWSMKVQRMHDAEIEMRALSEMYRGQ